MIKIEQLIPLLNDGWVAMDESGAWGWFEEEPYAAAWSPVWYADDCENEIFQGFDIEPVEDWTDSLIEIKDGKAVQK